MKFVVVLVVASVLVACTLATPLEDLMEQAVVADVAESLKAAIDAAEPSVASFSRVKRSPRKTALRQRQRGRATKPKQQRGRASKRQQGRMLMNVEPVIAAPMVPMYGGYGGFGGIRGYGSPYGYGGGVVIGK